jgi:hypothetical protein
LAKNWSTRRMTGWTGLPWSHSPFVHHRSSP